MRDRRRPGLGIRGRVREAHLGCGARRTREKVARDPDPRPASARVRELHGGRARRRARGSGPCHLFPATDAGDVRARGSTSRPSRAVPGLSRAVRYLHWPVLAAVRMGRAGAWISRAWKTSSDSPVRCPGCSISRRPLAGVERTNATRLAGRAHGSPRRGSSAPGGDGASERRLRAQHPSRNALARGLRTARAGRRRCTAGRGGRRCRRWAAAPRGTPGVAVDAARRDHAAHAHCAGAWPRGLPGLLCRWSPVQAP
jgi:hypothetical protein